jgi:phage terminase small subunit
MIAYKQTTKQARASALITSGIEPTQAMRIAGYSASTLRNPKMNLLDKRQVKPLIEQFRIELKRQGITMAYRVNKLKQFLEANKKDKEDYSVQMEALKILNNLDDLKPDRHMDRVTRRMTIEEFEEKELFGKG